MYGRTTSQRIKGCKRTSTRVRWRTATTCGVLALTTAGPLLADHEAYVYGIANFGGTGECSGGATHSVHEDSAAAFAWAFENLESYGYWDTTRTLNNTSAQGRWWTDSSKATSCSCTGDDEYSARGADTADVVFIHTHGSHTTTVRSTLLMGSSLYDCSVQTDNNMLFDLDLEIAVIKACQSGDYDVFVAGNYRPRFNTSASPFTMWNAFHGDSSCGSHVTDYVAVYAAFSAENGVGENWIDVAYDNDAGSDTDDCPVSIVMGNTESAIDHMYEYGGWLDREDTGSKTRGSMFYIAGCDPSNGRVLP